MLKKLHYLQPLFYVAGLLALLFLAAPLHAQLSDRLYGLLPDDYKPRNRNSLTNKEKVIVLATAGEYASLTDTVLVTELDRMAMLLEQEAHTTRDKDMRIRNLATIAEYQRTFRNRTNLDCQWVPYYREVITLIGDDTLQSTIKGMAYMGIGLCNVLNRQYEAATENYLTAFRIFRNKGDTVMMSNYYISLSDMYRELNLFEKSIAFTDSSELYTSEASKSSGQAYIYKVQNYDALAELYMNWYIKDNNKIHLDSSLAYIRKIPLTGIYAERWYNMYCYNMARYLCYTGDYKTALAYLDSSLVAEDHYVERHNVTLVLKGICLIRLGREAEGKRLLLHTSEVEDDKILAAMAYMELYKNARAHQEWKTAFEYYEKAIKYKDAFNLGSQAGAVLDITQKYAMAQKESEISVLNNKTLLNQKQRDKAVSGIIIALLVLCTVLLLFYLKYRKQNYKRVIAEQKAAEEHSKRVQELKMHEALMLAEKNSAIAAQRKKVAEDMHDDLSGSIAAIKFLVADKKMNASDQDFKALLEDIEGEMSFIYSSTRQYMHNLSRNPDPGKTE